MHRSGLDVAARLPDHDLHSGWGCSYTSRSMTKDDYTLDLWRQYAENPDKVARRYHDILRDYTRTFASFFNGYYPFSLHAHASDALAPTTLVSLVLNTAATSPRVLKSPELAPRADEKPEETGERIRRFALELLGWSEEHVTAPRFLAVSGLYGAGFGPLAHASQEWEIQAIASGPSPISVDLAQSLDDLDKQFADAKAQGCVAVVIDTVSTTDGSVVPPERFGKLKTLCHKYRLLMIVDETMTAMRCGAPFTFQRPEYASAGIEAEPDLVIFGKGLGVSGIAMGFRGLITKNFAFNEVAEIEQSLIYWRALVSRPLRIPGLIEALGVLRTAQRENWPARSKEIGRVIRNVLASELPPELKQHEIRGLDAVIAVHKDVSMHFGIMSALRRRSPWSRWLPKLDEAFSDETLLRQHVFGANSRLRRKGLAEEAEREGIMPLWCFICGIEATSKEWCRHCYLALCNNDECGERFTSHACLKAITVS